MNRKGQALIVAYTVIAVFMIIASSLLFTSISAQNMVQRQKLQQEAFYLAEGAVESGIQKFAQVIADYTINTDELSYTVETPFLQYGGPVNVVFTRQENVDRMFTENDTNIMEMNYKVSAEVKHPSNRDIAVTVNYIVARRLIPTFQHAVFYDDDLEMLPGPDMTLSGRIHCNQDLYMDSHNTLTLDSAYVRSAGDIFNNRKDTTEQLGGDVNIRVYKTSSYKKMSNLDCDNADWTQKATDTWKGTVQSAGHGVTKLTAPSVASVQPNEYYYNKANVIIENGTIKRGTVTLVPGTNCPTGTITTSTTLYNAREKKYITTTDIDMRKLAGYANATDATPTFPNNMPSNGLIYATTTAAAPGVRLVNASTLYTRSDATKKGLTVVSNDPVYIQGDYNTGAGGTEQPAAVFCDSLNILSNNWKDEKSKTKNGLSDRVATTTTVNCAFITGVDMTTAGNYNGGLENYPRFLEKWTGITLNIKGSFVQLWESQVAQGAWNQSGVYEAPTRNWQYNTAFNNSANLPPETPWAVEIRRVAWWKS